VGVLTSMRAAFCARIVGFGRVALGAGGGRAAVWGEEASGFKGALEVGTTTGGESCSGGCEFGLATDWRVGVGVAFAR